MTVPRLLVPADDLLDLIGEYNAWAGSFHPDERDEWLGRFADLQKRAEKALEKTKNTNQEGANQ